MNVWLPPASPLSAEASAFRRGWSDRWPGYSPRAGVASPEGTFYDHRHAYPEFRNPLSFKEGVDASVEFHAAVIERLAGGRPVTLLTFDFEWEWEGQPGREVSELDGLLQRDPLLSMVEEPEDDESTVTHVFISHVAVEDPRLLEVWKATANGGTLVTVVGPEMRWLARPHEECVAVSSWVGADLDVLREVERETWERWGVPQQRVALLDLARVQAYFTDRRQAWRRQGVRVVTEPQYRVWRNGEFDHVADSPPEDLSETDWFYVELESDTSEARVVVHDTGSCSIQVNPDTTDDDSETLFERQGHAGSLDFDGVAGVLERVVASLVSPADGARTR